MATALAATIYGTVIGNQTADGASQGDALASGLAAASWMMAIFSFLGVLMAFVIAPAPRGDGHAERRRRRGGRPHAHAADLGDGRTSGAGPDERRPRPDTAPAPFTSEDYAARMRRVVADATGAGLDGLLVTPGPDLVWLTGYRPTAITERLTVLVLAPDREPTLLVPTLERPDAEGAVGAPEPHDRGLGRRRGPVRAGRRLHPLSGATMGISDSAWAMHLLGLQDALPGLARTAR